VLSDLAYAHSNLASIIGGQEPAAAEAEHLQAIRLWERLAADHPEIVRYRVRLAETYSYFGDCLRECERFDDAASAYATTERMLQSIGDIGSEKATAAKMTGYARHGLAKVHRKQNRRDEAMASLKSALEAYAALAAEFPQMHEAIEMQADICDSLADLCLMPEQLEERVEFLRRVVSHRRRLAELTPRSPDYVIVLVDAIHRLTGSLTSVGHDDEVQKLYEEAIIRGEPLLAESSQTLFAKLRLQARLARIYRGAGQMQRAEHAYRESVELCRTRLQRNFENRRSYELLANALSELGEFLEDCGRSAEGRKFLVEFRRLRHESLPTHKRFVETRLPAAHDRLDLAEMARLRGEPLEAIGHLDAALETLSSHADLVSSDDQVRKLAVAVHESRAKSLSALDRPTEATASWDLALGLDVNNSASLRIGWARELARVGRIAEAADAVREISARRNLKPGELRGAAGVMALCANATVRDPPQSHAFADQAIELLRRAIARGYRNVEELNRELELSILRPRPGFDRLTAEIPTASAAP
jgi:tetratricopeptide (TPR) repeat protein